MLKTLLPVSDSRSITMAVDRAATEFEVQAYLYSALRAAGFTVRGEVVWMCGRENGRREKCRFDLLIYRDGKPAHIIEIKAAKVKHRTCVEDTRQGIKYRMFGIPVSFVYGIEDADEFLRTIKE